MVFLDTILASTRRRLPELQRRRHDIRRAGEQAPPPPSFRSALSTGRLEVVAEVKRRSPSRGELATDLDPAEHAQAYVAGGAAAISVLTEPEFFGGSREDLQAVVDLGTPVLRKDFVLDVVQIWEAAAWGASAVLLIVAALDDRELPDLIAVADQAGLDPLVEVHDEDEARRAVAAGAEIVGVNNRDLTDFSVDLATSEKIAPLLETVDVTIAESGVFSAADASRMSDAGYQAVLVGEALVRSSDPASLVAELRQVT